MNYLILAMNSIEKILEDDPNLNKTAREKNHLSGNIHETYGKRGEKKKKNWLSKYKF